MRSHRSYLCLLLCACILLGLFSVSAFATEDEKSYFNGEEVEIYIDDGSGAFPITTEVGYIVKQYWKPVSGTSWNQFTNTITTDTQYTTLQILFEIYLTTEIEKNSTFDVVVNFNSSGYSSITTYKLEVVDSSGNASYSTTPSVTVSGSKIEALDICNNKSSAYKLAFYLTVTDPVYNLDDGSGEVTEAPTEVPTEAPTEAPVEPTTPMFYVNNTAFEFEIGMNWNEWVKSSYNPYQYNYNTKTLGFYASGNTLLYMYEFDNYGNTSGAKIYYDNSYTSYVLPTDVIIESTIYYISLPQVPLSLTSLDYYKFTFSISSITVSLLDEEEVSGGILGWVKSIWNGIINLPSNIASKLSGFFTELGNKISDLGETILNGIKGLFIPTEDSIEEMKTKFEKLLEDRFGAVYESTAVIDNFANAFFNTAQVQAATDTVGTIHFPLVSVPLAGTEFSFGGWDVDLIPDSFEGIVELLKMAIDIVCTFVFINALRKKLEGILR